MYPINKKQLVIKGNTKFGSRLLVTKFPFITSKTAKQPKYNKQHHGKQKQNGFLPDLFTLSQILSVACVILQKAIQSNIEYKTEERKASSSILWSSSL